MLEHTNTTPLINIPTEPQQERVDNKDFKRSTCCLCPRLLLFPLDLSIILWGLDIGYFGMSIVFSCFYYFVDILSFEWIESHELIYTVGYMYQEPNILVHCFFYPRLYFFHVLVSSLI
jgi:hypothetical protein